MEFRIDTEVFSNEGNKVGILDRVVIDPKTKDITRLIVSEGFLRTGARVVPMSSVQSVIEGSIVLQQDDDEFGSLPEFEETQYIEVDEDEAPGWERALYSYPPLPAWGQTDPVPQLPSHPYVRRTERNIPEDLIALEEGAQVISSDGQKIGSVESIRISSDDQATHIVISDGVILKKWKLIPTHWISQIHEDAICLTVGSRLMDRLSEYLPES